MKMKKLALTALTALFCVSASADSKGFTIGKWMEIYNAVVANVINYYVDSLPMDKMFRDGIDKMLSDLDPYTVFVPESEQENFEMMISNTYGGVGAIIYKPTPESNVVINEPYENSPAHRAGLRCADEIIAINGKSVKGLVAGDCSSQMKGQAGTELVLRVKKVHSGDTVDVKIIRERIHIPDVEYYGMLDAQTGYISQTGFTEGVSEVIASAVKQMKAQGMKRLVLDLRGNGGGLMDEAVKIVGLFVPKGTVVVSSKGIDGQKEYRTQADPIDTTLPLLVLVDSGSASASEIVSGAIQDLDRGMIIGTRTYGKGLVQRVLPLVHNSQIKVTVAKYYTPSGRCVQAKDYAHRNEDGSVGNIPDSLIREFKTAKGRTVKDGGGITPDLVIKPHEHNRVTMAVVLGGLADNYAMEFVRGHKEIGPLEDFHLSDEEYEAFAQWASQQKFDIRSEAQTYYDLMVTQLKKDQLYDDANEALQALKKVIDMDKKEALMRSKEAIRPFVEEEIAVRYYFQKAGVQIRLRYDTQLHEALEVFLNH